MSATVAVIYTSKPSIFLRELACTIIWAKGEMTVLIFSVIGWVDVAINKQQEEKNGERDRGAMSFILTW